MKTVYSAVRINIAADGSVKVDTTEKRFATSTFRSYPVKSYLVALNYASTATCAPLTVPGTGRSQENVLSLASASRLLGPHGRLSAQAYRWMG